MDSANASRFPANSLLAYLAVLWQLSSGQRKKTLPKLSDDCPIDCRSLRGPAGRLDSVVAGCGEVSADLILEESHAHGIGHLEAETFARGQECKTWRD